MANTEALLAYFAGLLDGEGCITIKRSAPSAKRRYPSYVFSLCIEMADPRPIQAFCDFFGTTIRHNTSRHLRNPEKHRHLFVAQHGQQKGIEILQALLPYLIVKREEALVAIEYYHTFFSDAPPQKRRGYKRYMQSITEEEFELRHQFYLKLQALKTRRWDALGAPSIPSTIPVITPMQDKQERLF